MRCLDQITGNVFERGVDRQNRERRIDVRERENDGERAVEKKVERVLREVDILEQRV